MDNINSTEFKNVRIKNKTNVGIGFVIDQADKLNLDIKLNKVFFIIFNHGLLLLHFLAFLLRLL